MNRDFNICGIIIEKGVSCFVIPDFRVSTAILNTAEIFRSWYKLNFGFLQSHVKSRHFHCHVTERIDAKRQNFHFFGINVFLGITGEKRNWTKPP